MEGLLLATAGDDIKLWDCGQGFSLQHTFNPHCNRNIASLSWNSEGSLLASCSLESEQVSLTYTKSALLTSYELPCGAGVQCTDFTSSLRQLVCGGVEGVSVWDLKTKTLKKSFHEHKGPVTTVRYNWNDTYIASGSETGEIILHNVLTGQSSSPLVAPNVQAIRQLRYSFKTRSLFGTVSDDGGVILWDANARRLLHSFRESHVGPATGLAFSPLNERLMMSVGLDKRFICYDIQKQSVLKVYDTQVPITCIDVMSDGATAAVGSTRGKVYLYDMRQGGSEPIHVFQAHKTSVQALHFMLGPKAKAEEIGGGVKSGVLSTSGTRRQLPSAPTVMQDITPSKTGQTPERDPVLQQVVSSPAPKMDIFSPAALQGNQSHQHSKSASLINLTASRGEDSFGGVFSPVRKGTGELSSVSQSGYKWDASHISLPSFLGQSDSSHHHHHHTGGGGGEGGEDPHPPHHHPNLSAGHHSGMVHSPALGGSLPRPRMCSSPQHIPMSEKRSSSHHSQGTDASCVNGGGISQAAATNTSAAAVTTQCVGNQHGNSMIAAGMGVVSEARNGYRSSASPDSAAISGGEEVGEAGGGGLSLGRNSSPSSSSAPAPLLPRTNRAGWTAAAGPVEMGGASGEAGVAQREFLRSLVADAMEDMREELHRDIQGLHVSMLRQFFNFEREMKASLSHYAETNQKLLLYVRQLEEENKRLKKTY